MFHALVAVKLDDLFYRTLFQMHPIEVFPDENIDPARAGIILAEALTPLFDLAAFYCIFGVIGIERDLTLHRRRPHMNRGPA